MVSVVTSKKFQEVLKKIKDSLFREKVLKHVEKIKNNPEIGKLMKYYRKGTREVYIHPFRLSYAYNIPENAIYLFDLYHKDEQ